MKTHQISMGKSSMLDIFTDKDCLTMLGHAFNEMTDGVLGYFLPDLDQSITELLNRLMCNLAAPDGPKHNVPDVFFWI